jgi:hypothetical protein
MLFYGGVIMEYITWETTLMYCLFSMFIHYQERHLLIFNGSLWRVETLLGLSTIAGEITRIVYLVKYAYQILWWVPIIIWIIGILSHKISKSLEKIVGGLIISLLGFIGWPICAYFMFYFMPYIQK